MKQRILAFLKWCLIATARFIQSRSGKLQLATSKLYLKLIKIADGLIPIEKDLELPRAPDIKEEDPVIEFGDYKFPLTQERLQKWSKQAGLQDIIYPSVFDLFSSDYSSFNGYRTVNPVSLEIFLESFAFKDRLATTEISAKLAANLRNIVDCFKEHRIRLSNDPHLNMTADEAQRAIARAKIEKELYPKGSPWKRGF